MLVPILVATLLSAAPSSRAIDAGPLKLKVVTSDTAQLFHIADQLSLWSPYCHRQYRRYFESKEGGGLSAEDTGVLDAHASMRKRLGYGVLEELFYSEGDWSKPLAAAVKSGRISAEDAAIETRLLRHFSARVSAFIRAQNATINAAATGLIAQAPTLREFAGRASHFWGGSTVDLDIYLVASPAGGGGGGFNGGKLVVEVSPNEVPIDVALHESWHAFSAPHNAELAAAATRAGTDETSFSEALAYAVMPGLYPQPTTTLDATVFRDLEDRKSFLDDPYVRFNRAALALRPSLKEALDSGETFNTFFPRAEAVYRGVAELSNALENQNPRPRYFCFVEGAGWKAISQLIADRGFDVWSRSLDANQFDALKPKMRSSDSIILAASRKALLEAPDPIKQSFGEAWAELRSQMERSPAGEYRVDSAAGPRVAIWAEDVKTLPSDPDHLRGLLFPEVKKSTP